MDLTPNLREFTEKKLKRLDKYSHWFSEIHIIMYIEKSDHVVEAVVNANGTKIHALEKANDMYNSVDLIVHKIEKQIVKFKEKVSDHKAVSLDKQNILE